MRKNIIGWSILVINLVIVSMGILEFNANQFKTNFSYGIENKFLTNYFCASIALYYMYACHIEKLVKGQNLPLWALLKIILLSIFFIVILYDYGNIGELIITINIMVILLFYKQIRLLMIVFPIMFSLAFCSDKYFDYHTQTIYTACKTKDLNDDKIEQCINEFTVYNIRTGTTRYLTKINIQLSKENDKIKESIQNKIIKQNEDENCKFNENYEVMQTKNKKGIPCSG